MGIVKVVVRTEADGMAVVSIEGSLDSHSFATVAERLRAIRAGGCRRLLVDLSACPFVSSSGAGVLIEALCGLQECGGNLVLAGLRPEIRDTFAVLGLDKFFTIAATADAAARILRTAETQAQAS